MVADHRALGFRRSWRALAALILDRRAREKIALQSLTLHSYLTSMYGVLGHSMILYRFRGEVFGPAQRLHGARYVNDVEFCLPTLDANGIVVSIGGATGRAQHDHKCFWPRMAFDHLAVAIAHGDLRAVENAIDNMRLTRRELYSHRRVVRRNAMRRFWVARSESPGSRLGVTP